MMGRRWKMPRHYDAIELHDAHFAAYKLGANDGGGAARAAAADSLTLMTSVSAILHFAPRCARDA